MSAAVLSRPSMSGNSEALRGSGFEQYCRIAAPLRWREVLTAMLTGCFDAGGKDSARYNVLSVAGFASFSGMWDEFNQKWMARLSEDSLPHFMPETLLIQQGHLPKAGRGMKFEGAPCPTTLWRLSTNAD